MSAILDEVRAAKSKLLEKFDFASAGIGMAIEPDKGFTLEVRVKNEEEAGKIPKIFEGIEVNTVIIGKITPR